MSLGLKLINGSLSIKDGKLVTVSGTEKLAQDLLKICLTEVGANRLQPWYGSYISSKTIGNVLDSAITIDMIKSQLQAAIETLKNLQQEQIKMFQSVSADEQIAAISQITVTRNPYEPRLYEIVVKVLTKSLKTVPASFSITA